MCGKVKGTAMTQFEEEKAGRKLNHFLQDKEGLWLGDDGQMSSFASACRARGNGLRPEAGLRLESRKNLAVKDVV
jgi:hypothetical protein